MKKKLYKKGKNSTLQADGINNTAYKAGTIVSNA